MGCRGSRPAETHDGQDRQDPYIVGKRYKVARPLELWSGENLDGTRHNILQPNKDVVLLVGLFHQSEWASPTDRSGPDVSYRMRGFTRGLVIPQPAEGQHAGWISLEDIQVGNSTTTPALSKVEVPGSWELRARYSVQHPTTLRAGVGLDSEWLGDLMAGDEVLLLDLGVTAASTSSSQDRLRALVLAEDKLGWISPETGTGEHLLREVNLLSHKVVDIHQQALRHCGDGLRKSYQPGYPPPWKVGATYRVLEAAMVKSNSDLHSANVAQVSAGSLVLVQEIKDIIIEWGWCPVAYISVQEGPEKGISGWVRCSAKDGHDIMDTRDHNEYEMVLKKLKESADIFADFAMDARPSDIQAVNMLHERRLGSPKDWDKTPIRSSSQDQFQDLDLEVTPSWRNERMAAEFVALSESLRQLEELEQREARWMILGNSSKVSRLPSKLRPKAPQRAITLPFEEDRFDDLTQAPNTWPSCCSCGATPSRQRW